MADRLPIVVNILEVLMLDEFLKILHCDSQSRLARIGEIREAVRHVLDTHDEPDSVEKRRDSRRSKNTSTGGQFLLKERQSKAKEARHVLRSQPSEEDLASLGEFLVVVSDEPLEDFWEIEDVFVGVT